MKRLLRQWKRYRFCQWSKTRYLRFNALWVDFRLGLLAPAKWAAYNPSNFAVYYSQKIIFVHFFLQRFWSSVLNILSFVYSLFYLSEAGCRPEQQNSVLHLIQGPQWVQGRCCQSQRIMIVIEEYCLTVHLVSLFLEQYLTFQKEICLLVCDLCLA